ncbi:DUF6344 domain-containing protein [Streptomyces acidiscabies]|uniref:DUF6344 domain-containing protein n=1 Tax=Streptomyces acidiscabies TaxID=42234 RepID=UPI0038F80C87
MARTQVTKLWTTIVTALLSLFTALGLITTTATAAVAHQEPTRNATATVTTEPAPTLLGDWSPTRSLPPTMKQRIRAEAHGKSPNCRHLPRTDAEPLTETAPDRPTTDTEAPLQT